jgi:hypothetical protein
MPLYNKILNYITYAPTCFGAFAPSSGNFDIGLVKLQNIKIIKITQNSRSLYDKICFVDRW